MVNESELRLRQKRILIILGGLYHDFDGFACAMKSLFEAEGWSVESTYDLDVLTCLDAMGYQIVLSYTCLSQDMLEQGQSTPQGLTDEQVSGLADWVQSGGALLAVHSTTVIGNSNPEFGRLLGGVFISHPPPLTFTIYPIFGEHPIIHGIETFDVHDELYIERLSSQVDIHMVAVAQGVAYPMVWSKREGAGRIAHIALGHFPQVWNFPPYQRLMIQAAEWLAEER